MGFRPFADSLTWRPEKGSLLLIVDPAAERPAMTLEVPASWMWHTVNAYASGNTIIADFVGYDSPDHFLGPDAAIRASMQGREGIAKAHAGKVRSSARANRVLHCRWTFEGWGRAG